MLKTPTEYAKLLIDTYLGDHDEALRATFEAARAHKQVPAAFFRDVFLAIQAAKAGTVVPDGELQELPR